MKETIKQILEKLLVTKNYAENIKELLMLAINGRLSDPDVRESFSEEIIGQKELLADVILDFIESCLEDGLITREEMSSVKMLKLYFKIEEGDFKVVGLNNRVKSLLILELEKIYEDSVVDENEALTEVDLQEMFGLSYDEFLEIENSVIKK